MHTLCAGPDFAYLPPQLEGYPLARPVAELSGPPDDLAFPPADTDTGASCMLTLSAGGFYTTLWDSAILHNCLYDELCVHFNLHYHGDAQRFMPWCVPTLRYYCATTVYSYDF